MAKVAVAATLATMLVRFPLVPPHPADRTTRLARTARLRRRPRHAARRRASVARLLLGYKAADLTLVRVVSRRPDRRALRRRAGRPGGRAAAPCSPASSAPCPSPSAAASPAAACARSVPRRKSGGSRRSSSPSCTDRPGGSAQLPARLAGHPGHGAGAARTAAPVDRPPVPRPALRLRARHLVAVPARHPATVLCVAIPIKIWNSARIEHRLAEQEKLLMAARVEALANQINPHFLFNTLTSIIVADPLASPKRRAMLIVKLSGLLRRLLRSQEHFVTLREELAAVDEYLDIERDPLRPEPGRRQDRSTRAASTSIVPSMILQPLVENSIKHGLARKVGEGRITIHTSRRAGHAVIEVVDNGVGMPADRLEADARDHGIGLRNVNERLRVIYGANYQLQLHSVPGPGHAGPHRNSGDARGRAGVRLSPWRPAHPRRRRRAAGAGGAVFPARAGRRRRDRRPGRRRRRRRCGWPGNCKPDLLFLDVQMPGLTGFEVARRLDAGRPCCRSSSSSRPSTSTPSTPSR